MKLHAILILSAGLAATPALAQDHSGHAGMNHAQQGAASMLTASTPADGARLKAAPRALRMSFAHPVVLESLVVVDPAGKRTALKAPAGSRATHTVVLPALGRGAHVVEWRTSGGHAMQGRLSFTVAERAVMGGARR